ncbi:MAG: TaqI-like C-terminal specificity domain-containing protein, partial [Pirellulales bacterium]
KLSLLLKALEGETKESIDLILFHKERALPDLAKNIRCGNSLIGQDFYNGQQQKLFDEEERYRINVFDWKDKQGFPEIFKGENSGFDAVIGNPPYLFITEVPADMREYYQNRYSTVEYRFDLYGAFVERALRELLRTSGRFGFIIPHTLLSNDSFLKLRALIATESQLFQVVDFGPGVFKNAKNETMLLFFENCLPTKKAKVRVKRAIPKFWPELLEEFDAPQLTWAKSDGSAWLVHVNGRQQSLLGRMSASPTSMSDFCTSNQGVRTGDNDKYLDSEHRGPHWERAAGGKQIARYRPVPNELYVYYLPSVLDAPRRRELFTTLEKIIIQEIRNISLPRRLVATLDTEQVFGLQSTNVINLKKDSPVNIRYILGILNSNPINVYFRYRFPGNNHIPSNQLLGIPIPNPESRKLHDRMVTLVQKMLDLHARIAEVRTDHERTVLQRQIDHTDRQIDALVYDLYGLTAEEIALVEEATK